MVKQQALLAEGMERGMDAWCPRCRDCLVSSHMRCQQGFGCELLSVQVTPSQTRGCSVAVELLTAGDCRHCCSQSLDFVHTASGCHLPGGAVCRLLIAVC